MLNKSKVKNAKKSKVRDSNQSATSRYQPNLCNDSIFFIKEQQKLIPLSSKTCTEFIGHSGFIRPFKTRIFSYRLANRWKKKQENRGKYWRKKYFLSSNKDLLRLFFFSEDKQLPCPNSFRHLAIERRKDLLNIITPNITYNSRFLSYNFFFQIILNLPVVR